MATEDVRFDPAGGPLRADIRCGQAQEGAYSLTLFEGPERIVRFEGTFESDDDDAFVLPGPASDHDGRVLRGNVKVSIEPPIERYAVTLTIVQDGEAIGEVVEEGEAEAGVVKSVDLFANLES